MDANKKTFVILIFLSAALLVGSTLFNHTLHAQTSETTAVSIAAETQTCAADSDCVLVDVKCSDCCGYQAISKNSLEGFKKEKEKICTNYHGGICDCYNPKNHPVCKEGHCILVNPNAKPAP